MYHCRDGLFFERLPFGDMRIVKTDDGNAPTLTNVIFEATLGYSETASIMAFICARGYSAETFYQAYEFLKADKPPKDPHGLI